MCVGPGGQRAAGSDEERARWRRRRNGIDERRRVQCSGQRGPKPIIFNLLFLPLYTKNVILGVSAKAEGSKERRIGEELQRYIRDGERDEMFGVVSARMEPGPPTPNLRNTEESSVFLA